MRFARLREAGEIALDVGEKHRGSGVGEAFGEQLQRDGLAAAGRAGDQAVAIAEREREIAIGPRPPHGLSRGLSLVAPTRILPGTAFGVSLGLSLMGAAFREESRDSRKATSSSQAPQRTPGRVGRRGRAARHALGESRWRGISSRLEGKHSR